MIAHKCRHSVNRSTGTRTAAPRNISLEREEANAVGFGVEIPTCTAEMTHPVPLATASRAVDRAVDTADDTQRRTRHTSVPSALMPTLWAYSCWMAFTRRSEPTRAAILASARNLLAQRGYQGTTIRAVAAHAGIDPSMVMRYYTNKEGLFAAAVDVDLHLPQASRWPREQVGELLARHFVSIWEGDLHDEFITLLLRSATTNPTAAEQMRKLFQRQVVGLLRDLIGDDPSMSQRAGMVSSQILGIALCRYVLELPPLVVMDPDTLVALVAPVLQHYLFGDLDTPRLAQP